MITIVLFRPEVAGNVGAIARAMSNFGFESLAIVSPKCDVHSKEALDRAKHAKKILLNAKITDEKIISSFDYCIGTTGILGTDYNIPRSPIKPKDIAKKIAKLKKTNIALVFGPEGQGLTNQEILDCDFIVTIPTNPKQPIMNLSHAVSVILYELYSASTSPKQGDAIAPVSKTEKEHLLKLINKIISKESFNTPTEKETQRRIWKRIIGKSFLTKREAFALFGFFRRFEK